MGGCVVIAGVCGLVAVCLLGLLLSHYFVLFCLLLGSLVILGCGFDFFVVCVNSVVLSFNFYLFVVN